MYEHQMKFIKTKNMVGGNINQPLWKCKYLEKYEKNDWKWMNEKLIKMNEKLIYKSGCLINLIGF